MAYIGVSPSNGVRRKHTYTATANQTSFSGAGAEGATLSYNDSNFVDVYQNGVKLSEADYTSTSGTAIVLATGATVSDMVEIVVYDVFSVTDTVSKADGGTFDGAVTFGGGVSGNIANVSGDMTIDVAGDIILDADGGDVYLKDGGTEFGRIGNAGGRLFVNNGDVGLNFAGDADQILPSSAGTNRDAAIDLGTTNVRFKDLYLSSGVFLGGTGAANELTDYEEGTFTPTLALSGATLASTGGTGRYTKIGRHVYVEGKVTRNTAAGGANSFVQLESLPFTSLNANSITEMGSGTMWMDEGGPGTGQGDTVGHALVASNGNVASVLRGTSSGAQTSARYGIGSEMTNGRPLYFNFVYTTA